MASKEELRNLQNFETQLEEANALLWPLTHDVEASPLHAGGCRLSSPGLSSVLRASKILSAMYEDLEPRCGKVDGNMLLYRAIGVVVALWLATERIGEDGDDLRVQEVILLSYLHDLTEGVLEEIQALEKRLAEEVES